MLEILAAFISLVILFFTALVGLVQLLVVLLYGLWLLLAWGLIVWQTWRRERSLRDARRVRQN